MDTEVDGQRSHAVVAATYDVASMARKTSGGIEKNEVHTYVDNLKLG